jgi:hypothetical protein
MGFMASHATFYPHNRMFENERPSLIAMAAQASRLVAENVAHGIGPAAAMRIVAIDAGHCTFQNSMFVGLIECAPLRQVAACTILVDFVFLEGRQLGCSVLVHRVACRACDLILGMPARKASGLGSLVQVASQAGSVNLSGRFFIERTNIFWIG